MLLYHGSNQEILTPKLVGQTRGLDFGAGFYLTSSESQASDFSRSVIRRTFTGTPTVSVYTFDEALAARELRVMRFHEPDEAWLTFIRDNRLLEYAGDRFDIIHGPVADDRVYLTIQALVAGQFSIETALTALKPFKLFDQYCFASEKALAMLSFVRATACGR